MVYRVKYTVFLLMFFLFILCSNNSFAIGNEVYINIKDVEYPYFSFNENQEPQGYIYDIFQIINNKQFDLVFTTDTSNHDNGEQILGYITENEVPEGYYFIEFPHNLDYYVFTRRNTDIKTLGSLFNKKITILKDDLSFKMLYRYKASYILEVKSYNYALKMLAKGTNDCAIVPYQIGVNIIADNNLKNIDYIITPLLSFNYGIAIPITDTEIIRTLKSGLKESIENNKYKIVENRWFDNVPNINNKWNSFNNLLFILILVAIVIIIILLVFIKFLRQEIVISTTVSVNELGKSNYSPLTVDLSNPLINKLISTAPIWLFINDTNGKVLEISNHMLLDVFNDTVKPDNLMITDIFDGNFSNKMASLDRSFVSRKSNLIAKQVEFEIKGEKQSKFLIKYPLQIMGNNRDYFINIISKPLIEGDYNFDDFSAEYLLNAVIDTLPDLIFIKNINGEYLGGNKTFFDFHKISESEIIGKTDIEISSKADADNFTKSDSIVFTSGEVWENTGWVTKLDGDSVKLENIKIPLRNKKNEIFGLVGISHDVTRRHRYEQDLETAKAKVEESDRVKSSFLANMSHEIRTPMNSIIGFSDLLADPDLTIGQRVEIIDMIQANGHTLIDLIDDIIDFSRLESGKIHLKYSDFNLHTVISNAYDYGIAKKVQLDKEHLNITFILGSVEDAYMINSDPFRLRQVLKNLLNNSIRYSTSETLFLGYIVNGDELLMYIKNENNKVNDEVFERLNSENTDVKFSISDIEESSGIALIIAKKVIEMIGGQLFIDEKIPGRPDFYFTIPLKNAKLKTQISAKNDMFEVPKWKGKSVLVAEDEEINFMLIQEILSKTDVQIIRANNGKEAVDIILSDKYKIDLVLMDIRMPELNGVDASRKILKLYPDTIIIAQTAYVMPEDKEQYIKVGIKNVIKKPIDPSELYYSCNKYLS